MRIFLKKIASYLLLFLLVYVLIFFISNRILAYNYSDIFTSVIHDKYDAIQNTSDESRIIFMGGSNTIYSIDSEKIEKETGRTVINSGLVYNTGYQYQLNFIQNNTKPGDIVVYIPEFAYYSNSGKVGVDFLYNMAIIKPESIKDYGLENFISFLRNGQKVIFKPITAALKFGEISSEINRSDFNEYGDLTFHLGKASQLESVRSYPKLEAVDIHPKFIETLEIVSKNLQKKKVKFWVTFPVYANEYFGPKAIRQMDSLVLNNSIFLGDMTKNLFDVEMFYDSPYHALDKARETFTSNLIIYTKNAF